jgi:tetratricopeptide (TPR) repeat protein
MSQEPAEHISEETSENAPAEPSNKTRKWILGSWAIIFGVVLVAMFCGWHPTCDNPLGTMNSPLPSERRGPPTSANDYLHAASKHLGAGRDDEGLACIRKAVALEPNNAEAQMTLGSCCWALGLRPEAIKAYEKVIAIDGDGNWGEYAKDRLEAMRNE